MSYLDDIVSPEMGKSGATGDMGRFADIADELLAMLNSAELTSNPEVLRNAKALNTRLIPVYERLGMGRGTVSTASIPDWVWLPLWKDQVADVLAAIEGGDPRLGGKSR